MTIFSWIIADCVREEEVGGGGGRLDFIHISLNFLLYKRKYETTQVKQKIHISVLKRYKKGNRPWSNLLLSCLYCIWLFFL